MTNPYIKKSVEHYAGSKISEQTKVREILQQAALFGLERHGFFEKAAFYGGTALRILYGLDRFSEDLDFTLLKTDEQFDFSPYLEGMRKELESLGYKMEISKKTKGVDSGIQSAFMKVNTIQLYLTVGEELKNKSMLHPNEKIQIKLEVDTTPPPHFRYENRLVLNPAPFYVLSLTQSDLFAGKMHAIIFRAWKARVKGRDWYDLIWYIQKKIPLGLRYLQSCMVQSGDWPLDERLDRDAVISLLGQKIDAIDWEAAKSDVRPFIVNPEILDIWSASFFRQLLEHLVVE